MTETDVKNVDANTGDGTERARTQAVEVAKSRARDEEAVVTLSSGVRARIHPVAASLIAEVSSKVEDPPVPTWFNPDKEREEPNPSDPEYLRALERAEEERSLAAMDAMILFGVELVDPIPTDGRWLQNLRLLERMGKISLEGFDLNDPIDIEFLYKRYVAVTNEDYGLIGRRSGISAEDVDRASRSFPGNA